MSTSVYNASGQHIGGPLQAINIHEPSAPSGPYANATPVDAFGKPVHPEASAPFDPDQEDGEETCYPELDTLPVNNHKTHRKKRRSKKCWPGRPGARGGKNTTYKVRKTRIKSLKKKTKKTKKNKTKNK